jgi:putative phosphoribosyl transferase
MSAEMKIDAVRIPDRSALLDGDLHVPARCIGVVIFAHGSGSSRFSPRNRQVAAALESAGCATLLLDLLTREEEAVDLRTREYRFDIERLARRVIAAADWASEYRQLRGMNMGYFGASTGAAAALIAAAERPEISAAVVSRGGRPDLAGDALSAVRAPTLLIVGGDDEPVIELNEQAKRRMRTIARIEIIPGATHLFEEHGALEQVERLAADWFREYLPRHAERGGALDRLDGVAPGEK